MLSTIPNTLPKFLWRFAAPRKVAMGMFFGAGLFWAIHNAVSPYFMKLIIDGVSEYDRPLVHLVDDMMGYALVYMAMFFMVAVNYRLRDYLTLITIPSIQKTIWAHMFSYLKQHSHRFFQDHLAGNLTNKINDLSVGFKALIELFDRFSMNILAILIASVMMYLVHPFFAGVLLVWSAVFIVVSYVLAIRSHRYARDLSEARSTVMGIVVDSVSNTMNTRLFSRYRYENKYLDRYLTDTMKKDKKLQWYLIKVNSLQDLAMLSLLGVMLALLLVGRAHQQVTVGDFAFILSLSASIFESLWQVTTEFVTFSEQWGTCQQGLNILLASHDMRDKAEAQPLEVTEGVIEFKEVCFGYRTPPLFDKLSLNIRTGEKVGLVGASGSGKTTFTNLILRLYDISSGHITIDGQDIANVTRESLRRQISLIPQEPNLFHRTLMENIRYARLDATNEEVIAAAKKAHCHDFIEELEEGYDTVVGERGLKLSGGQRQLISIARAILKGAPIVIFDEASSALDSVTERYIQDSLDDFMRNRTAVVIAHRLGTLRSMDRILVFKQGRIIEQGTHESLLKQNGEYYRLWESQTTMPDKSGDGGSVVVDEVY